MVTVTELIYAVYLLIGLYVFYQSLKYYDNKHDDGDPEGLDALVSLGVACFWPVTVPLFLIYKLCKG